MEPDHNDIHEQFLTHFAANEPAIRAYVRRLVPTRHDAADVMQGVALVLWRKFDELDDTEHFRRWAFGVARHEALGWLRDKARSRLTLAEDVLHVVACESTRDDDRLSAQREALEGCLEKLPTHHRKIILAAYAPDAAIQEVAGQSGRTVAAFYQWLHRMRLRLLNCTRQVLQAEGLS
ncbi:sigma-70 family RNA polymerase sigma factor [Roseiconus nitratireducens]|uniref:Sigma-70 family RNA polymerase sigma factor n=1 Tax=Roseiconus nitratireducens TaxID=2605748 RepID=A0A5M6D5S8_9BACT|nr:sigma-70 family RNA polymerase sigma factor [Roseiconus nitratireducens]KAA5542703.1 sigma-70 family RNA polymerase sigma factor [Roseiconus nitratireducens]